MRVSTEVPPRGAGRPAPSPRAGLLTRRFGGRTADRVLWGAGIGGGVAIVVALVAPGSAPMALLLLLTVWTNGPHSPVLPAAYEPILMLFGRLYAPVLVAVVGTVGVTYVEYLNYHLYAAGAERLPERMRAHPVLAWIRRSYARAPFATVVIAALTPLPFWLARVLSVLTGYSLRRHLAATAVGRFPRLWFFAAVATPLGIPTPWLIAVSVVIVALLTVIAGYQLVRRRPHLRRTVPPLAPSPSPEVPCCS